MAAKVSFVEAAVSVLQQANEPLAVGEIIRRAVTQGLIEPHGLTPEKTLEAKLSTDLVRHGDGSRFMRTDHRVFALRAWSHRFQEFVAPRQERSLLDEEIMVFGADELHDYIPGPGVHRLTLDESSRLLSSAYPMWRREAEERWDVIQLVSQFLVVRDGRIATHKRTRRLPENRLHGYFSALFGGHLNPEDVPPLLSIFDLSLSAHFIQRELREELRFTEPPELRMLGVLYDDRVEISRQHLGLLYQVVPSAQAGITIGERGFLQQLRFETSDEVLDRVDEFENWSELVVRAYGAGTV